MEFFNRKKAPTLHDGELSQKRHVLSGIRVDDGECDDHMCDGHQSFFVKCTCGHATRTDRHDTEPVVLAHRLAVIQYHLGLSIKEDDDV